MRFIPVMLMVMFLVITGCSGGSKNPVSPDTSSDFALDNVPVIGLSESGESSSALGLMGAYELNINPDDLTAELVSKRMPTVGESYLVNGMRYFTVAPCKDCLTISGIGLTAYKNIELMFTIRHPFQIGDPHKEPSGKNRNDLDLFDPILVVKPVGVTPTEFPLFKTAIYDNYCLGLNGYTNELANLTGDSALCPYFLIIDDSLTGAKNYNRFPQGSTQNFSAYFKPAEKLTFDLFLTFGYGVSATFMERLNPKYFNPEFNRKNAWKVQVFPPQGNLPPRLGNTWQENDPTTKYKVAVKVWDWQFAVQSVVNPPVEPGDIAFSSNVKSVSVEIPGMTSEIPSVDAPNSGSGDDPRFPLVYYVPVANENRLPPGEYLSLVKILDERVPSEGAVPGKIDSLINIPPTGGIEWFDIPEYATYQTFIATVVHESCETEGAIVSPPGEEYTAYSSENVSFTVEGTPFGHNVLVAYWADWGSGTYTDSSATGEFQHVFTDSDCPVFADDQYTVKFGMELDCTDGEILLIDSILVKMTCPPCNASGSVVSPDGLQFDIMNGETIDFELEATPNGGNVIAYWADWGTGTYTESSPTPQLSHQFISDACPPIGDAPPDVGDLTLAVNRNYVAYGVAIAPDRPYTLSWVDPGGSPTDSLTIKFGVELDCWPGNINCIGSKTVKIKSCYEFEIYWDNNPDDGLTNAYELVDAVSGTSWNAPEEHLNVNGTHYVEGITYAVYAKNCLGARSINPSQPAHVMVSGAETATADTPFNAEGWQVNNRSGDSSYYLYAPYTSALYAAHGSNSIRFGDLVGQSAVGTWEGISRAIPSVPDASIRFIEFSMFKFDPG